MRPPLIPMRRACAVAIGVLATATVALASESARDAVPGAQAAQGHDSAAWLALLFSFVNFSAFVFLIRKYAWPAVRDFLSSHRKEVADALAAAEQARQAAEDLRREYGVKEAALEETRCRMLDEIRQGAAADRERSLRDAEAAVQRLRAEVQRQAEHDLARARRELRTEAAKLAAQLAEREVRARLTDADRTRLVREFVEGVASQ